MPDQFEPPQLDPRSPLTDEFMDDLTNCALNSGDWTAQIEELVLSVGSYFRRDVSSIRETFDDVLVERVRSQCVSTVPDDMLTGPAARVALANLENQEFISFVYGGVHLGPHDAPRQQCSWIVATHTEMSTPSRLLLVDDVDTELHNPTPAWTGAGSVVAEQVRRVFADDCRLTGGQWADDVPDDVRTILIPGKLTGGGFRRYFAPLLERCTLASSDAE